MTATISAMHQRARVAHPMQAMSLYLRMAREVLTYRLEHSRSARRSSHDVLLLEQQGRGCRVPRRQACSVVELPKQSMSNRENG